MLWKDAVCICIRCLLCSVSMHCCYWTQYTCLMSGKRLKTSGSARMRGTTVVRDNYTRHNSGERR